jgi:hypothetical protein
VLPTNSTIHVEVIATHRLSDLRRVVTGLGYQSLRLEFTPTTSGTVAMPGLAGMVLAPESPHSPSPAGNNSRSKRSQNSSDALPPMYPYLFLLRDRVHLTRFLACLIEQVEWFLQVLQALHFLKKNCFVFCAMMKRKKKKKKKFDAHALTIKKSYHIFKHTLKHTNTHTHTHTHSFTPLRQVPMLRVSWSTMMT